MLSLVSPFFPFPLFFLSLDTVATGEVEVETPPSLFLVSCRRQRTRRFCSPPLFRTTSLEQIEGSRSKYISFSPLSGARSEVRRVYSSLFLFFLLLFLLPYDGVRNELSPLLFPNRAQRGRLSPVFSPFFLNARREVPSFPPFPLFFPLQVASPHFTPLFFFYPGRVCDEPSSHVLFSSVAEMVVTYADLPCSLPFPG